MNSSRLRVFWPPRPGLPRILKDSKARRVLFLALTLASGILSAFSDSSDKLWAERTLKSLSLRDRIAQLVQIRVPARFLNHNSEEFRAIQKDIQHNHVGGLVLFAGNIYESAVLLNELQKLSQLPLLVAGDFERGAAFRIEETTSFPWAMALGATGSEQLAYRQGVITAHESRALGVHWIFAPVMDVNNNPNNPVINIRSFGEDPELVARLGSAFIRGAKSAGVLTTAKHFPGHGDTATDSHLGLAVVPSDLPRLQSVELVPFRRAIEAGVDSIMTAHVSVPNVTGESQVPATLSSKVLTGLLRDTLQFKGLVVTDALEMGGVTQRYWSGMAAVRAIQAGADVLLLPLDATVAIDEVERAVKRGDISEARINEAASRILLTKSRLGLHKTRSVSIRDIADTIASPDNLNLAQEIADQSITVLRDKQALLPVDPTRYDRILNLVMTPDLESAPAAVFQSEMRRRFPLTRNMWVNSRVSDETLDSIDKAALESDLIVCSTVIRLVSGRAAAAIPEVQRKIFEKLEALQKPLIWVAFGNPYVLPLAPEIGTYVCTFSYSDVSQIAAAKALAGAIGIRGKMPVSIPGFSKAGEGQEVPRLEMTLKPLSSPDTEYSEGPLEETAMIIDSLVEDGIFRGATIAAGYQGKLILSHSVEKASDAPNSPNASADTVYSEPPLSWPVSIGPAAMLASESGNLLLNLPVRDYLPDMRDTDLRAKTFQNLMKLGANGADARARERILESIISRTTGTSLERLLTDRLYKPLGMDRTFLKTPRKLQGTIPVPEKTSARGFFSSARDLAVFAQMLLNRGVYAHSRYFKIETVDRFTAAEGIWSKPSESDWTGKVFSSGAFGHILESGSMYWIDPGKKLFIVLLVSGKTDSVKVTEAQRKICESIIASLRD